MRRDRTAPRAATGPGWGGPAKGAGTGPPARAGNPGHKPPRPDAADRAKRRRTLDERAIETLTHLMDDAEHEMTRYHAATHLLDRIRGKPKTDNTVTIKRPEDMTAAELSAVLGVPVEDEPTGDAG